MVPQTMADYPYLQDNQCGTYIRDEGTQGVWSTKQRNQRRTIKCPVIGQFSKFNIHILQVKKFARYTWWSDYLHNDVRKIIINVLTHLVPSNTPTVLQHTSLLSVLDSSSARVSQPNLVQFMCKFFTCNASPSESCTLSLPKNRNLWTEHSPDGWEVVIPTLPARSWVRVLALAPSLYT
jgi:hypothetical protein